MQLANKAWKVALPLMLGRAFAMFFTGVFGPISPFLVGEFGLSESEIGLASSAIYVGAIVLALPMGKVIDRRGTRNPLIAGTAMIPLLLLLLSRATGLWAILAVFLFSGLPRTLILPATEKGVAQLISEENRAMIMGAVHSGPPLAGSLISAAVPALAVALTWRMGVASVALFLVPLFFWLRSMLMRLPLEEEDSGAGQPKQNQKQVSIIGMLKQRRFLFPAAICACFQGGHIIILTFFVLYLTEVLALSPVVAGLCLATAQMFAVAGRPAWGVFSDRLFGGRRELPLAIMGGCGTAAFSALAVLPPGIPQWVAFLVAVLGGGSIISARPMVSTFAIEGAGIEDAAKISSILLVSTWSMFIVVPILFGYVVTLTSSWTVAWLLAALLLATGAAIPLLLRRKPRLLDPHPG